jgi:hypothetical protein
MDPYLQAILGSDPAPYGGQMPDPRKAMIEALQRRRFEEQQQAALVQAGALDPMTAGENQTFNQPEPYEPGAWKRQLLVDAVNQFVPRVGENEEQTMYKADNALLNIAGIPGTGAPGVLAAVKQPGGNFSPSAVQALQRYLAREVAPTGRYQDINLWLENTHPEFRDWTERSAKRYLERYAGTEGDPLKDRQIMIQHPQTLEEANLYDPTRRAVGTVASPRTWEQAWDKILKPITAKEFFEDPSMNRRALGQMPEHVVRQMAVMERAYREGKITPETVVWDLAGRKEGGSMGWEHNRYRQPVVDFLGHVGAMVRANVPLEEMKNYDLTRAVRELPRWEQAKQAANAAKVLEGTQTTKEYPDKFKWVKVNTDEALNLEGQQMGHCVGSYCDRVRSGNTEIYSLRDASGQPHVTVEVTPRAAWHLDKSLSSTEATRLASLYPNILPEYQNAFKARGEHSMHYAEGFYPWVKETHPEIYEKLIQENAAAPKDIRQVKGKQNRAPVEQYLPYVQDFVKSGNWGEIGDLHNTGLHKFGDKLYSPEDLAPHATFRHDIGTDIWTPHQAGNKEELELLGKFLRDPHRYSGVVSFDWKAVGGLPKSRSYED